MIDSEIRQRPSGGLELIYPLGQDVVDSMLGARVTRVQPGALDQSVRAIQSGEAHLALLWGADYNSPIGTSANGSARVKLSRDVLTITLGRYLDTPAARTVQALVSDRVPMSVGLGIVGLDETIDEFTSDDGRTWTRRTVKQGGLCEGRIRLASAPGTRVSRRWV